MKTVVTIIVYNRYENIERWIDCWKKCDQTDSELVVIQSVDRIGKTPIATLCSENGIKYFARLNKGMDIGAFAEVCQGRIIGFPEYHRLLWITDDVIPMRKDFVKWFTGGNGLKCMEIASTNAPLHVRTTGFSITKDIANRLVFGKLETKMDCYDFEHRSKDTLMLQVQRMGYIVEQVEGLPTSPLWDMGNRAYLKRMNEHLQEFKDVANDKVTVICPIYNSYPSIISSMISQTHQNWELLLIHDGKNETNLKEIIQGIGDSRVKYSETSNRSANWGHKIRSEEIQKLPYNGYVLITNADNYHVPTYLEKMLTGFTSDRIKATFCSKMVHSYIGWGVIDCRLQRGYIDCAGVLIRNEVAKRVGWNDITSHSADWFFFNDIAKMYGESAFKKVEGCLLIHN
jgi:hypothetical protein